MALTGPTVSVSPPGFSTSSVIGMGWFAQPRIAMVAVTGSSFLTNTVYWSCRFSTATSRAWTASMGKPNGTAYSGYPNRAIRPASGISTVGRNAVCTPSPSNTTPARRLPNSRCNTVCRLVPMSVCWPSGEAGNGSPGPDSSTGCTSASYP